MNTNRNAQTFFSRDIINGITSGTHQPCRETFVIGGVTRIFMSFSRFIIITCKRSINSKILIGYSSVYLSYQMDQVGLDKLKPVMRFHKKEKK